MYIDQRALDLAKHLLDKETKSKTRSNKRSPSATEPMYNIRIGVEWFMHGVGLHL